MSLSSEQGPPAGGNEAGARFRRVRLTRAPRQEEGAHLFAFNEAQPCVCHRQTTSYIRVLICYREGFRLSWPASGHSHSHALPLGGEHWDPSIMMCLSTNSATPLQPSSSPPFEGYHPPCQASPGSSVLPQPYQGTELTGRLHITPSHKNDSPPTNCLRVGGAI